MLEIIHGRDERKCEVCGKPGDESEWSVDMRGDGTLYLCDECCEAVHTAVEIRRAGAPQ